MVDMVSITGAITSLKAAKDIAQAMHHLQTASEIKTKVIDLQNAIMSAQSSALDAQGEQHDLQRTLGTLEAELARLRAWEEDKRRYALREVSSGIFVQSVRDECLGDEPKHWLCCNCFDKGEKAILQLVFDNGSTLRTFGCQRCKGEIAVATGRSSAPPQRGGGGWEVAY